MGSGKGSPSVSFRFSLISASLNGGREMISVKDITSVGGPARSQGPLPSPAITVAAARRASGVADRAL